MIRPRCQRCGSPSEQAIAPVEKTKPIEFYCCGCMDKLFVANLQQVAPPMRQVSADLAKRSVTGTN